MTMMSVSGWMFLLVPAHTGCPGQISQSRKTVVCVRVGCEQIGGTVWQWTMLCGTCRGGKCAVFKCCLIAVNRCCVACWALLLIDWLINIPLDTTSSFQRCSSSNQSLVYYSGMVYHFVCERTKAMSESINYTETCFRMKRRRDMQNFLPVDIHRMSKARIRVENGSCWRSLNG